MTEVAFYEAFEEEAEALRGRLPDGLEVVMTSDTIQESSHSRPPAPLISVRTQSRFPRGWLGDIEAVLTRSTGYDHILELRRHCGFRGECGYLPRYCARSVAEHAAMLWMALLRRLTEQIDRMETFNRDGLSGFECRGRTLGVFGVGNIGIEIVDIGKGLGMETFGVDIVERHPGSVRYIEPETALKRSDVIVASMSLTRENRGYFDAEKWRMAGPETVFVNIARGELSPAAPLLEALESGLLWGVGLDVYPEEKTLAEYLRSGVETGNRAVEALLRMREHPNVIFTPHNAFNSRESVRRKALQSIQQIESYMAKRSFLWPVPTGYGLGL